ncbi:MAG: hypothetical protein GWN58_14740, partial [Anaerolineae bacterium]|nr:hypothetical protein [Anaerolineae bacterium]
MSRLTRFPFGLLLAWMLASCGTPAVVQPTATTTPVPPIAAMPQATATVEQSAEETIAAESTAEPAPFPLLEPGKYYAGKRRYAFEDASRD